MFARFAFNFVNSFPGLFFVVWGLASRESHFHFDTIE